MIDNKLHWNRNSVDGLFYPSQYSEEDYELPPLVKTDFNKLMALVEHKYMREYLKVCAYYNKIFPSLKSYDWSFSSYNAIPFTVYDQERSDTGTGISCNYMKSVIDTVIARISNITFDVSLEAREPFILLEMYKYPVERYIRQLMERYRLEHLVTECFHDAAILGYSHIFMDPWTNKLKKVSDWEMACFEPEFNEGRIRKIMIRDFMFPVTELDPYIKGTDFDVSYLENKLSVDLKLYIDAQGHKATACIDTKNLEPIEYPFDEIQISTLSWDLGTKRTTVSSLFDQLFPLQREMSKLMAKQTQLLTNYKGPVPVFSTADTDAVMKAVNNSAGEALFIDSRDTAGFMTVINPCPLDPALAAEIEGLKSRMYEIAGVQEISMDMENYRSAAAVIALDQMRDAKYQSQLFLMAEFVANIVKMFIRFEAGMKRGPASIPYDSIMKLINDAYVAVTVNHDNKPDAKPAARNVNYQQLLQEQFVADVLLGIKGYKDIDYTVSKIQVTSMIAVKHQLLKYLGTDADTLARLEDFLLEAFIDSVKRGQVELAAMSSGEQPVV